jgi:hypothetical protein
MSEKQEDLVPQFSVVARTVEETRMYYKLIRCAIDACTSINNENPLAVAEELWRFRDVLHVAMGLDCGDDNCRATFPHQAEQYCIAHQYLSELLNKLESR